MDRDLHRRMAAALAILLTTLLALCAPALAVVPTGSLTLTASYGTTPLVGAPFKLYLVAEHDAASDFALCGEFAGSSVDLSDLSTAGKLAQAALDLERGVCPAPLASVSDRRRRSLYVQTWGMPSHSVPIRRCCHPNWAGRSGRAHSDSGGCLADASPRQRDIIPAPAR